MGWNNQKLVLYHGSNTSMIAAASVDHGRPLPGFQINVAQSSRPTDFGRGFYATTNRRQACEWANEGVRRLSGIPATALVLAFEVDRDALAALDTLIFVTPTDDYFDFVEHCRLRPGQLQHRRGSAAAKAYYDVVFGPVSLGFQRLVIHNCDQVSFHNQKSAGALLANPVVIDYAYAPSGLLP